MDLERRLVAREDKGLLAKAVERVMTERGWSLAQAQIATGVNRGTLNNMRTGLGAGPEHIAKFARAIAPPGEEDKTARALLALAARDKAMQVFADYGVDRLGEVYGEYGERRRGGGGLVRETRDSDPPRDPLLDFAEDMDASPFLSALEAVVDVGANFERITDNDETSAQAFGMGPVRAMRIRNDCMCPALNPGDLVFVGPADTVRDGDIVIAAVDILARTCKRIRIPTGDDPSYLEPMNGEGRIPEDRFTVLGVVAFRLEPLNTPRPPAE